MKVRFYVTTGVAGSEVEEDFEFDDTATSEEIEAEFRDWLGNQGDRGWYKLDK